MQAEFHGSYFHHGVQIHNIHIPNRPGRPIERAPIQYLASYQFKCSHSSPIVYLTNPYLASTQMRSEQSPPSFDRITQSQIYSFPLAKFEIISLPVTQVVLHNVGKSKVLVKVSAYPNPNMGGIQPLAYSSAKHASSILYCLTVPR
jgi:hypothetical protein